MLRIDQFDLLALCLFASRFDRGERDVVDMVVAIIIFLRGGQDEPGTGDHPVYRLAGAVHAETSVGRQMYQFMIRAYRGVDTGAGNIQAIHLVAYL